MIAYFDDMIVIVTILSIFLETLVSGKLGTGVEGYMITSGHPDI